MKSTSKLLFHNSKCCNFAIEIGQYAGFNGFNRKLFESRPRQLFREMIITLLFVRVYNILLIVCG